MKGWMTMTRRTQQRPQPTFEALRRAFDEAVAALASSSLWITDDLRAGVFLSAGPGVSVHEVTLPDRERFRSIVMDFRKLIADEPSNVNRVVNEFMRLNRDAPGELRTRVAHAGARFNNALDERVSFWRGADRPTIRESLDCWMNGDWFHGDAEKRQQRLDVEFAPGHEVSLVDIVPAIREATAAALDLRAAMSTV
jgi:hypothetical protein